MTSTPHVAPLFVLCAGVNIWPKWWRRNLSTLPVRVFPRLARARVPAMAECVNGVVVHCTATGRRVRGTEVATVRFTPFGDDVIEALVAKGEVPRTPGRGMRAAPGPDRPRCWAAPARS